jgi:hypothetical protein
MEELKMKKMFLRLLFTVSLILVGAASSVWTVSAAEPSVNLTAPQWVGNGFTFLALPADKQAAGYEIFAVNQAEQGFQGDRTLRLSYANHVGKEVTVTNIVSFPAGNNQNEYMVYMTVNDTGEKLVGRTMRGQLEGLVLTADLVNARQQFLGKTVYPKYRELTGAYDPGSYAIPDSISTPIGGPAAVVDVYAGNQSQEPIWLIVTVNGEKAILPIAYSYTNVSVNTWTQSPPWQDALFIEDPRASFGWSQEVWNAIESSSVVEGMTKEQIRLSWGKANRIDGNGTTWIYGDKKLNFSGDVLQSLETVE